MVLIKAIAARMRYRVGVKGDARARYQQMLEEVDEHGEG
jgi:hypothetical protein